MEKKKKKASWRLIIIIVFILIIVVFAFNKNLQSKTLDFINSFKRGEKAFLLTSSLENDRIVDINIYNNSKNKTSSRKYFHCSCFFRFFYNGIC